MLWDISYVAWRMYIHACVFFKFTFLISTAQCVHQTVATQMDPVPGPDISQMPWAAVTIKGSHTQLCFWSCSVPTSEVRLCSFPPSCADRRGLICEWGLLYSLQGPPEHRQQVRHRHERRGVGEDLVNVRPSKLDWDWDRGKVGHSRVSGYPSVKVGPWGV